MASRANITMEPQVALEWAKVQDPEEKQNWLLCSVSGGLKKKLSVTEKGPGGHPHFQHLLKEDSLFFGGFKTTLYDSHDFEELDTDGNGELSTQESHEAEKEGATTSVMHRYIFFFFCGSKVAGFKRAKMATLFKEVGEHFKNCQLRDKYLDKESFATAALEVRLKSIIRGDVRYDWTNGMAVGSLAFEEVAAPPPPPTKIPRQKFEKKKVVEPPAEFKIRVRLPSKKTLTLTVAPTMLVSDLKALLSGEHAVGIEPADIRLTLKKKAMKNEADLAGCGAKDNSLIMLKGPFSVVVVMPDQEKVRVICKSKEPAEQVAESLAKTHGVDVDKLALIFKGVKIDLTKSIKWLRIFNGDEIEAKIKEATRVSFLVSTFGDTHGSVQNISKIILDGFKVKYELVDGALPEFRERRNELFVISGRKGEYPQLFVDDKFIGCTDQIVELNETGELQKIIGPIQEDPTQQKGPTASSGRFDW